MATQPVVRKSDESDVEASKADNVKKAYSRST